MDPNNPFASEGARAQPRLDPPAVRRRVIYRTFEGWLIIGPLLAVFVLLALDVPPPFAETYKVTDTLVEYDTGHARSVSVTFYTENEGRFSANFISKDRLRPLRPGQAIELEVYESLVEVSVVAVKVDGKVLQGRGTGISYQWLFQALGTLGSALLLWVLVDVFQFRGHYWERPSPLNSTETTLDRSGRVGGLLLWALAACLGVLALEHMHAISLCTARGQNGNMHGLAMTVEGTGLVMAAAVGTPNLLFGSPWPRLSSRTKALYAIPAGTLAALILCFLVGFEVRLGWFTLEALPCWRLA